MRAAFLTCRRAKLRFVPAMTAEHRLRETSAMASDNKLIRSRIRRARRCSATCSRSTDAPVQDLMRIAREQGPIFWLDMMGTPLVVVSGADLVAELCDEKRFDKAVRGSLRRVRAGGDALFTAETQEPNWRRRTTSCCRRSPTA